MPATLTLIAESPRPFWLVSLPPIGHSPYHEVPLLRQIQLLYNDCAFRGVPAAKWRTVLQTGIDVDPTSSVIYAEYFEKALEYGDWPKLVLALRHSSLASTFKEVPTSTPETELAILRQEYQTIVPSTDGHKLWLSRLSSKDSNLASASESAYARWIPGDAMVALAAIFLLVRPEDVSDIESVLRA
jgi:hypothetical protein